MPSAPSAAPTNNPVVREVENVMAEGLEETYQRLDPATQWEFKQAGEATATAISSLLAKTKVHVRKIIKLLTGWLKMLPGVSRLFIEQEAKIKADKLLALRRSLRRDDE